MQIIKKDEVAVGVNKTVGADSVKERLLAVGA